MCNWPHSRPMDGISTHILTDGIMIRPGPNIPLNLPIIQIIILHLSTALFKNKLPIILKKS